MPKTLAQIAVDAGLLSRADVVRARELADEWENRPHLRVNALVPGPIHSPLRGRTHPGEDKAVLPTVDALLPLYRHLIAGQDKAASGQLVDAQAWLAGAPWATPLRA